MDDVKEYFAHEKEDLIATKWTGMRNLDRFNKSAVFQDEIG